MTAPLWRPSDAAIAKANLTAFTGFVNERHNTRLGDYDDLHRFSVTRMADFWSAVWDFCGVIGDKGPRPWLIDGDKMPGARFFPGASLSFAENLLRRRDSGDALVFRGEDGHTVRLSHGALYDQVSRLGQALERMGVGPGDRVAAIMPNIPETIIAMLAANSLGAVWSSCSPDFGVTGVLDRFGQIEPKILIACDGYSYNGKTIDLRDKLARITEQLPSVKQLVI
ncbi:MAG TPA: acetoacetate--CoA ligase, partial [Rhodobacteraceae bacterium]|nr:acetoacetate--CoA ligase [Paracoccaceae bacterium]